VAYGVERLIGLSLRLEQARYIGLDVVINLACFLRHQFSPGIKKPTDWWVSYSCRLLASFDVGRRWGRIFRAEEVITKGVVDTFREHPLRFHFQLNEEWMKPCIGTETVLSVNLPANNCVNTAIIGICHLHNFHVAELRAARIQ